MCMCDVVCVYVLMLPGRVLPCGVQVTFLAAGFCLHWAECVPAAGGKS